MLNDELLSIWSSLPKGTVLFPVNSVHVDKSKSKTSIRQIFRSWSIYTFKLKSVYNNYPCRDSSKSLETAKNLGESNASGPILTKPLPSLSSLREYVGCLSTSNMFETEDPILHTERATNKSHPYEEINQRQIISFEPIQIYFFSTEKPIHYLSNVKKKRFNCTSRVRRGRSEISVTEQVTKDGSYINVDVLSGDTRVANLTRIEINDNDGTYNKTSNNENSLHSLNSTRLSAYTDKQNLISTTNRPAKIDTQPLTAEGCFQKISRCRAKRYPFSDNYSSQSQQYAQIANAIDEVSKEYQNVFNSEAKKQCTSWFASIDNPCFFQTAISDCNNEDLDFSFCSLDSGSSMTFESMFSQLSFNLDNASDYIAAMNYDSAFDLQWQEAFHKVKNKASNVVDLLDKFALAMHELIQLGHSTEAYATKDVYSDTTINNTNHSVTVYPSTTWLDIYSHFYNLFQCGQFTVEHIIYVFSYVTRMLQKSKKIISDLNWRMISTAALLTAAKVLDDCSIFNADFITILPELCLVDINIIERAFLDDICWNVNLRCHEFAAAYFYLNNHAFIGQE
ncbi:hypothetical protein BDF20DRAFT_991132 [Mycotypha africana]|uniref:uncharacterized protein n=1 Tax=Mycotypha africana TaxID=64632 RepID=UPI0022FFE13F|nr:uncharacterized protein BDF20DRAFT_991132 [Mycotypha africana]KAI8968155.1 hypothetical protein BDF20DRAFT_991132 [Mycotypha africana]